MLYQLLLTAGVLACLMALWLGVQHLVRRQTAGAAPDCDVLDGRMGCHGCALHSHCSLESSLETRSPDANGAQSPTPKSS